MKYYVSKNIFLLIFLIGISGCSFLNYFKQKEIYQQDRKIEDVADQVTEDKVFDDLVSIKNTEIDSLYSIIEGLNFTIDSLATALEISNSRVAVNTEFQIPDSIEFAGRIFNLTNDRLYNKLSEIYELELKSAHKFIPRSGKYFAIFDSIFSKYEIPLDMKYLAIAESSLSSLAISRVGAVGIWQFMKSTAKGFGLKIDSFIDERRNIFLATEAAAKFMKNNYNYLSDRGARDWLLAMSAYNAGAGSISRVIKEQGGTDFFDLILKADETHRFVWRAVAIKMIFENEEEIFGKKFEREKPLLVETRFEEITLKGHYKIDEWANAQGSSIGKVWEYNPWIKIYQRSRKKYSAINDVVLPPGKYSILVPKNSIRDETKIAEIESRFREKNAGYFTHHIVKKGDTLYDIARKYKTTVSKIKSLNGLKSNIIRPNQKIKLYGTNNVTSFSKDYYIVKKGDSVGVIAKKLGTSTKNLIAKNDLKSKNGIIMIYPGQKLVY
ncbi:MAG: LysM peptidoglycan-binding domain-containing protein [Candidatus Cloacimonetes bacterium]|nr:LysM peptidoglycan-binding domain-containing protein [Candidatus Cloacimonadota bacterium]